MGVIAQYQVSASNPSIVGGTGTTIKYFSSNPPQSLWNSGVTGVNSPISSAQLGGTPSSTTALGQLSFDSVAFKLNGSRFRIYASGTANSATTSVTYKPIVQIQTGTIASPTYSSLLAPSASGASTTASIAVGWSIAGDLYFDPTSGTIGGFMKYTYVAGTGSSFTNVQTTEAAITVATGLTAGGIYATQFGLAAAFTFGTTSDASNTASLYEFKIVQD